MGAPPSRSTATAATARGRPTGGEDGSGTLTFGPIAVTRMMCPQPSLDQRVSTALSYVRTYLIKDGQLHMSLMADAGILTWEPA